MIVIHGDTHCPVYDATVLPNEKGNCSLCDYGMDQVLSKQLCSDCRKIRVMSVHRNRCKPCYNEWFKLYRLERKAKASEAA